jgi:DNA-binding MarR family transcriptional regulator
MMKMTNPRTLMETAASIKELAGKLEGLLTEDAGGKPRIKINAGALFDAGINEDDLYALIDISSRADDESGITGRIRPGYRARSMRKLEARGYLRKVHSDESAHVYELCGPERCVKLPQAASAAWEDTRLSFYDRLVYAALCLFSNTFGKGAALSAGKIANAVKCWESYVREALRNLERHGLITTERRPGTSSVYRINESAYEARDEGQISGR